MARVGAVVAKTLALFARGGGFWGYGAWYREWGGKNAYVVCGVAVGGLGLVGTSRGWGGKNALLFAE